MSGQPYCLDPDAGPQSKFGAHIQGVPHKFWNNEKGKSKMYQEFSVQLWG